MEVIFDSDKVLVDIIRKDNKNIYFRISDDLILNITCNKRVNDKEIMDLIKKNEKSLTKMYIKAKEKTQNNQIFKYLGNEYTLVIDSEIKSIIIEENLIFIPSEKQLEKFLKKEMEKIFTRRINSFKEVMDFVPPFTLKIRKMKTRWGVCNKTNKIVTLNSELIKQDAGIIDYVIIHELCHFKHPNHSKKFWDLVFLYYPDYKRARKILRES